MTLRLQPAISIKMHQVAKCRLTFAWCLILFSKRVAKPVCISLKGNKGTSSEVLLPYLAISRTARTAVARLASGNTDAPSPCRASHWKKPKCSSLDSMQTPLWISPFWEPAIFDALNRLCRHYLPCYSDLFGTSLHCVGSEMIQVLSPPCKRIRCRGRWELTWRSM